MNQTIKKIVFLTMMLILGLNAKSEDDVLYWMVTDQAIVHYGSDIYGIMSLIPEADNTTLAARVRVTGGNITEDTFLNIYIGDGEAWEGDLGIDFDDPGSGYWGVGNPVGIQSPLTGGMSNLPVLAPGDPEYYFAIEIGNYNWDDDSWTTVASSATRSYTSLETYIHQTFDMSPPSGTVWHPDMFYASSVPEPSSFVLVLIGFGLLMLIRKSERKVERNEQE